MLGARLVSAELVSSNFAELFTNRRRIEQEQKGGFNPQNQQHKHSGSHFSRTPQDALQCRAPHYYSSKPLGHRD